MTALYLVGDVFERVADLRRRGVRAALVLCSPPFLALRSYLPDGHPLKAREIGSEATPAAFVHVMLALVAELGHVLAPWGSIAFELGDTYAGSGGAGGDYLNAGLREGQPQFTGSAAANRAIERAAYGGAAQRHDFAAPGTRSRLSAGAGWPLDKSLAGIPQAFMLSLAYGYNVLDRRGPDSPAGRWMVRNLKPWIRSNPPVGALGDKERPATSYVIVATRDPARYFDLDAVRMTNPRVDEDPGGYRMVSGKPSHDAGPRSQNQAGAPPLDWCHSVDMVLDAELDARAGKADTYPRRTNGPKVDGRDGVPRFDSRPAPGAPGARGVHLRRALERAGILSTLDALDVSPKGYRGAHYAVWPPELVRRLVLEMCPRRVCATCGRPSRRIVERSERYAAARAAIGDFNNRGRDGKGVSGSRSVLSKAAGADMTCAENITVGWSDCGHDAYQPGIVLDPFVGSGTTLQVVSGMGLRGIGIDLDYTNVALAMDRVGGLFLDVEWPEGDLSLPALGAGSPHPASYERWRRYTGDVWHLWGTDDEPEARSVVMTDEHDPPPPPAPRPKRRHPAEVQGQADLFAEVAG